MYKQRSSPTNPLAFTSLRQALSFGLLAAHLALISFNFSSVSLMCDGLAAGAAGAGAVVVVWADAAYMLAASSTADRQTPVRSMRRSPSI
jgi:hypothetical protein